MCARTFLRVVAAMSVLSPAFLNENASNVRTAMALHCMMSFTRPDLIMSVGDDQFAGAARPMGTPAVNKAAPWKLEIRCSHGSHIQRQYLSSFRIIDADGDAGFQVV